MNLLEFKEELEKLKGQFEEVWASEGPFDEEYHTAPVMVFAVGSGGKVPTENSQRYTITGMNVLKNALTNGNIVEMVIEPEKGEPDLQQIIEKVTKLFEETALNTPVFFLQKSEDKQKYYTPFVVKSSSVGIMSQRSSEEVGMPEEKRIPYVAFHVEDPFESKFSEKAARLFFMVQVLGISSEEVKGASGETGLEALIVQRMSEYRGL